VSIIDDLIANPGVYIGLDRAPDGTEDAHGTSAARIVVTPLPGNAGVTVDYETFNASDESRVRGHAERAIVGRTDGGGAVLVTGHIHADSVAVLREREPGVFVLGDEPSAFPMSISISVPSPGKLVYVWAYGMPGEEPVERDRAEVTLAT
jgi:hypothetical protein